MSRCIALLLAATGLAACSAYTTRAPVIPPRGLLYTDVHAPLKIEMNETKLGAKHGEAKVRYLSLWFLFPLLDGAWGDAAIAQAASNGDIKTVRHADYELLNVLGVYNEFTVYVYGD